MGGSVPPLPLIPYSFIVCVWTNLLLYAMSNHTRIYIWKKKIIMLARLYGGCDRFGVGGCNRRRLVERCYLV